VADLDGDGEYEIILKQEPNNAKDNAQDGVTDKVLIDAYKLNGTRLWRIDLGRNIRAGAHYTQFMVYDLDGDGRAEVALKTADGTVDGQGKVIGDASANHVNSAGRILTGPEFFTIFDGRTGAALATVDYVPGRGNVGGWGGVGGNGGNDTKGNRVDRMTACIAYLDGVGPSVVMGRGYYGRSVLAAWDWRGGKLSQRWVFDTDSPGNQAYAGQGAHGISVGDVDEDGRDEIVFGAMTLDDDGKGLYSTGFRHGDALHFGDLDPARPGLEVYMIHENEGDATSSPGADLHSARTGEVYFKTAVGQDVGRGVAADINPDKPGAEFWGTPAGVLDVNGRPAGGPTPSSTNFVIWWDGDLTRELLDGNTISKAGGGTLLNASGASSNNGSKSTPALTADIFGDWREEVIFRAGTGELRIYTTTSPTTTRIHTLMHDPIYRLAVAWQNVAYNQPPHTSFYLGNGMTPPPRPNIYTDRGITIAMKRKVSQSSRSGRGFGLVRGNVFLQEAYGAAGGILTMRDLSGRLRLQVQPGAPSPEGGIIAPQGVHVISR
jgi:rhamnogalacturonan endolyase